MKRQVLEGSLSCARDFGLEQVMWPPHFSEHEAFTDFIETGCHDFAEFVHVGADQVAGDLEDRPGMDSEDGSLKTIFDTVCNRLTLFSAELGS